MPSLAWLLCSFPDLHCHVLLRHAITLLTDVVIYGAIDRFVQDKEVHSEIMNA